MNQINITSLDYQKLHGQLNTTHSLETNYLDFIINVFTSSEERYLFWGNTEIFKLENADRLECQRNFINLLRSNWGDFMFFILEIDHTPQGFFAIYNVSISNKRAEFLAWIEYRYRSQNILIKWWILFLNQLQTLDVTRIFGKIRQQNLIAIKAAKSFGFEECGLLPEYFINAEGSESAYIFTRSTEFNKFEILYSKRRCLN
jgi:RimJ/RimL family protein N-acetyltransferase